jgi:hypothetical protein
LKYLFYAFPPDKISIRLGLINKPAENIIGQKITFKHVSCLIFDRLNDASHPVGIAIPFLGIINQPVGKAT